MTRPDSLTPERAASFLPKHRTSPEWRRKHDAGELPTGLAGLLGCLMVDWSASATPSVAEAEYILHLRETHSWRALACVLTGDDLQPIGMDLEEAARRALGVEVAA